VIRPKGQGGASSSGNQTIVLKLAHGLDESHPVHKGMEFMKKRLEELTGARRRWTSIRAACWAVKPTASNRFRRASWR
jgi:DNA polymerase IIIc chi subunit